MKKAKQKNNKNIIYAIIWFILAILATIILLPITFDLWPSNRDTFNNVVDLVSKILELTLTVIALIKAIFCVKGLSAKHLFNVYVVLATLLAIMLVLPRFNLYTYRLCEAENPTNCLDAKVELTKILAYAVITTAVGTSTILLKKNKK